MTEPTPRPSQEELERVRFAAIVASSDDAIVSKDLDGTIRSWNPAAERIFGYSAEEMVGDSIFRLIPPELHGEEHELLGRIRAGQHVDHYETDRVRKNGVRIRVSLTLSPLFDSMGRLIGASAIKRDVTLQRALELRLQQAQRMETVGRLAGGIAHDFNNLLTVIGGLTTFTLRHLQEGSTDRRNLEQVVHAVERASALTQQLLTFSRGQVAEVGALAVEEVVHGVEPLLQRLLGEHITLRVRSAADLGRVRANRAHLEQVVMNLAINARDAMPGGGTLTIETQNVHVNGDFAQEQLRLAPGPYVMLAVSDTGQGMDAVTQASIFEPFFTTKGQGTGLGLSTVYGVIQQMGGAIYVYSELGRGSVFKVYLPRIAAPAVAEGGKGRPTPAAEGGSAGEMIVVAEDEPAVLSFAVQVLEEAGYRVIAASSGEEAERLVERLNGRITLLLTDVVMPGINGRVLAERLRVNYPSLAVLYTSGYTDDTVLRAGVVAAEASFLQKPFTPEQLLERVRSVLSQTAARPAT